MFERLFHLQAHGTTVRTEVIAGLTTFLTMAYIVFVNPEILAAAGMPRESVFVATCLAAAIGSAIMGLYANYPIAMAPGMGLNAYFAFVVVGTLHYSWQAALGAVFLSGCLFVIVSVLRLREWIVNAIPRSLKLAISAGIGLFLALIGLKNAGLVVDDPATLVTLGPLHAPAPLYALAGLVLIVALQARKVTGGVVIGILVVTVAAIALGHAQFAGLFATPPSLAPTFLQLDIGGALDAGLMSVVLTFFLVELFDATGTLVGVSHRAGLLDADGKLPRLNRALLADSTAIVAGAALGTSSTTAYIESAAGTSVGGRTGLVAVVVALLFLGLLIGETVADQQQWEFHRRKAAGTAEGLGRYHRQAQQRRNQRRLASDAIAEMPKQHGADGAREKCNRKRRKGLQRRRRRVRQARDGCRCRRGRPGS